MMLVAVLGPRLIPDTTRSGRCSRSVPTASFTQSAGVPFTDRPTALPSSANSFTRSGVAVVIACPIAEFSVSGATMLTAPSSRIAATRACRPGEVTPSSLVTKMRGLGLLMRSPQASLPLFACFKDEFDDLVPRVDPGRAELEVGRICEHQGGQSRIAWLDMHGIPFWDLCFMRNKAEVGANLYVEDAPANVEAMRNAGLPTLVFTNSTNLELSPPRVDSWDEVVEFVLEAREEWKARLG